MLDSLLLSSSLALSLCITQPPLSNTCYSPGCLLLDFSPCMCNHTNEDLLLLILQEWVHIVHTGVLHSKMLHRNRSKPTDIALIHSFNGYKISFCVDIHNLLDHSPTDGHYFQVCHYKQGYSKYPCKHVFFYWWLYVYGMDFQEWTCRVEGMW